MKFDSFILFLLLSIGIAYFFPQLALYQDGQLLSSMTTTGVFLIFFFYGLKLSFKEIKTGLANWRLHVVVQLATFLIFPLVVLLFRPFVQTAVQENFWLSFFFLATLPSTVSSSVVMVSIAKGNIPAAIFNASISGLIGVLITPIWMALFLDFQSEHILTDIYIGLLLEIILPVLLGLFLQRYWGVWATRYSKLLTKFDKFVILLIVYSSFAESFSSGIFENISRAYLLNIFIGVLVLFILIYVLLHICCTRLLKLNRADTITAVFCGSKKSLTHGSVFGKFLFAGNPNAALFYLPLMVFHAFQIFVVTIIAQRLQRESNVD